MKEWKCICGGWVSMRHQAHSHAVIPTDRDPANPTKELTTFGLKPEVWTYEREQGDTTR